MWYGQSSGGLTFAPASFICNVIKVGNTSYTLEQDVVEPMTA
jgi:hypothetical protein